MTSYTLTQLRAEQVAEKLGIGVTKLYELAAKDPDFPKPIHHSPRWVVWFECELDAWMIKKAAKESNISVEEMGQRLAVNSAFRDMYGYLMKRKNPAPAM